MRISILILLTFGPVLAADIEADARRGASFFEKQRCSQCHGGSGAAPDLLRRSGREYTPAAITSRMWNHAPIMWQAMRKENMTPPPVSEEQAADLFAFLSSARYFERAADAARGRRLFESKRCASCHALESGGGPGLPVSQWVSLTDPIVLIERMWNHAGAMKKAFADNGVKWQRLDPQELSDIVLYLQTLPGARQGEAAMTIVDSASGADLFKSKGCADCHTGAMALEGRLADRSLLDVATAMWNHAPKMLQIPPALSDSEMRRLAGYVWARQFFKASGDARRGERVFREKHCATCHDKGEAGAPKLAGSGPFSAIRMTAALWRHGPKMLGEMEKRNLAWPQISPSDLANLVAYLDSRK